MLLLSLYSAVADDLYTDSVLGAVGRGAGLVMMASRSSGLPSACTTQSVSLLYKLAAFILAPIPAQDILYSAVHLPVCRCRRRMRGCTRVRTE